MVAVSLKKKHDYIHFALPLISLQQLYALTGLKLAAHVPHRLEPKRIQCVYPKPGMDANMVLIEVIKDGKTGGSKIMPGFLVADASGEYTPAMKKALYE